MHLHYDQLCAVIVNVILYIVQQLHNCDVICRYNAKPYEGDYHEWISEEGKDFPCRLDCKPKVI